MMHNICSRQAFKTAWSNSRERQSLLLLLQLYQHTPPDSSLHWQCGNKTETQTTCEQRTMQYTLQCCMHVCTFTAFACIRSQCIPGVVQHLQCCGSNMRLLLQSHLDKVGPQGRKLWRVHHVVAEHDHGRGLNFIIHFKRWPPNHQLICQNACGPHINLQYQRTSSEHAWMLQNCCELIVVAAKGTSDIMSLILLVNYCSLCASCLICRCAT